MARLVIKQIAQLFLPPLPTKYAARYKPSPAPTQLKYTYFVIYGNFTKILDIELLQRLMTHKIHESIK
jgi:hypothetical protein